MTCTSMNYMYMLFFKQDVYVKLVSEFKLETSISEEIKHFCVGFWKVCAYMYVLVN